LGGKRPIINPDFVEGAVEEIGRSGLVIRANAHIARFRGQDAREARAGASLNSVNINPHSSAIIGSNHVMPFAISHACGAVYRIGVYPALYQKLPTVHRAQSIRHIGFADVGRRISDYDDALGAVAARSRVVAVATTTAAAIKTASARRSAATVASCVSCSAASAAARAVRRIPLRARTAICSSCISGCVTYISGAATTANCSRLSEITNCRRRARPGAAVIISAVPPPFPPPPPPPSKLEAF
jgi:hypothetical protein